MIDIEVPYDDRSWQRGYASPSNDFLPACKAERLANTSATRVITMASRNEQLPGNSTRPRHRSASIQRATETPLSPRTLTASTAPLLPDDRWSSATRQILKPASRPRNVHIDPTNIPRDNRTRCQTRALIQDLHCPRRLRIVRSACLPRLRSLRLGRQGDRALGSYQRVRKYPPCPYRWRMGLGDEQLRSGRCYHYAPITGVANE